MTLGQSIGGGFGQIWKMAPARLNQFIKVLCPSEFLKWKKELLGQWYTQGQRAPNLLRAENWIVDSGKKRTDRTKIKSRERRAFRSLISSICSSPSGHLNPSKKSPPLKRPGLFVSIKPPTHLLVYSKEKASFATPAKASNSIRPLPIPFLIFYHPTPKKKNLWIFHFTIYNTYY